MDEFALIRQYFAEITRTLPDSVSTGIGDDCAVLTVPAGQQLVVSIDTLVEGTHFLAGAPADSLAWRLLGAAVSDLAAMGAEPAWLTLAISLPEVSQDWLQAFSKGLAAAAAQYQVALIGGDTTRGPLTLSAQVHGFVPHGQALLRQGAQPGDCIVVTGTLGDSRAGLACLLGERSPAEPIQAELLRRFYKPEPRIYTGLQIRPFAHACIDISDGLLADLGHILAASHCGARIDSTRLPLSEALLSVVDPAQAIAWALTGGEDFELCFTLTPEHWAQLQRLTLPIPLTCIGEITADTGIQLYHAGRWEAVTPAGFNHFAQQPAS